MMKRAFLLLSAMLPAVAATASELTCVEAETLTRAIPAGEVDTLRLTTGSGRLLVQGLADTDTIRVRGLACASNPELLSDFSLDMKAEERVLVLTDRLPEGANHPEAHFAKLHLNIEVPRSLRVEIDTQREPSAIGGVAALKIRSRHGDIRIDGVVGDAEVTIERGDAEIRNIGGDLVLSRDRGEAVVHSVRGNVRVTDSERGNVLITDVTGTVHFARHGRGNLAVQRVGGDFVVDRIQEGQIYHEAVAGQVLLAAPSGLPEGDGENEVDDGGLGPPHRR